MLECNRYIHKKITMLIRSVFILLPLVCMILLLSQVAFAKTTYRISDGDTVILHTTHTTDPKEVLNEAGLELGEGDTYTTQPGLTVSEITIQRRQQVTLIIDGQVLSTTTQGESVESLLTRLELMPKPNEKLSVDLEDMTYDGMYIVFHEEHIQEETYTVDVDFNIIYCLDETLEDGQEMILLPGSIGQTQYVDIVRYIDGREISRANRETICLREPVDQLVAVNSLDGIPQEQILDTTTGKLPENMVHGTMIITDRMIITSAGEVLTFSSTLQVVATAYNNQDPGCTIYTAIGTLCRVGAIAVDPKVIPYGTRMFIHTNDGKYIYGVAVAEDCGSAIKGNRVDLYFDTTDECWEFGIRDATVYFLG